MTKYPDDISPKRVPPIEYFTIPGAQSDFRCPSCNKTWVKMDAARVQAARWEWLDVDDDGWFECCNKRFRFGNDVAEATV